MSHWKFTLDDDYTKSTFLKFNRPYDYYDQDGKLRLTLFQDGIIIIWSGYSWDGCSPKVYIGSGVFIGVWDGQINNKTEKPELYYPSLVHDALCQFYYESQSFPLAIKTVDKIFLSMMKEEKFMFANLYYVSVRIWHCIKSIFV
jgi:hypothetical protein